MSLQWCKEIFTNQQYQGTVSARRRGVHDINKEITFEGRPDLILHDSEGFEGGSIAELDTAKAFVRQRSMESDLSRRLHVIWYASTSP